MAEDLGLGVTVGMRDLFSSKAKATATSMKELGNQAQGLTGKFDKVSAALQAVGGAVVFQKSKEALLGILTPAMDFQKAMAMVNSRLTDTTVPLREVQRQLMETSNTFGVSATEQAQGLTQILTGGIEQTQAALDTLQLANKLAAANNVGIDVANDAMLRALNTFQMAPDQMAHTANILQIASEAGTGSLQEFSMAVEQGGALVHSMGGNFLEFSAILATLRNQGLRGRTGVNALVGTMTALENHTKELQPVMRKLGFESLQAAVRSKGLVPTLDAIVNGAGLSKEALEKLGLSGKAFETLEMFTGQNFGKFRDTFNTLADDTSTLSDMYTKATGNISKKWEILTTRFENMKAVLGEKLLDALEPVIAKMQEWSKLIGRWIEQNPKAAKAIAITIGALTALGVVLGGVGVLFGLLSVVSIPAIVIFLKIAAVVAVLGGAIYLLKDYFYLLGPVWDWLKEKSASTIEFLKDGWLVFKNDIVPIIKEIGAVFKMEFGAKIEMIKMVVDWLKKADAALKDFLKGLPLIGKGFEGLEKGGTDIGLKSVFSNLNPFKTQMGMFDMFGGLIKKRAQTIRNQEAQTQLEDASKSSTGTTQQLQDSAVLKNMDLSSVRNPNVKGNQQIVNNITLPKPTINASDVYIDKQKVGRIMYDMEQLQAVRS